MGNDNIQSELVTVWDEGNAGVHNQTQSCHLDSYFHEGFALRWEEIGRKSKNKTAESLTSFYSPSVIPCTRCSWMRKNSTTILCINYERWSAVTSWQYPTLYTIALGVHHICIDMFKKKKQLLSGFFLASKQKRKKVKRYTSSMLLYLRSEAGKKKKVNNGIWFQLKVLGITYYWFPFCRPGWLTEERVQWFLEGSRLLLLIFYACKRTSYFQHKPILGSKPPPSHSSHSTTQSEDTRPSSWNLSWASRKSTSHHTSKAKLYCLLDDGRAAGFEQRNSWGTFFEKSFSFQLRNWVSSDKCEKPLQAF